MMALPDNPTAREVWRLALPLGTLVAGGAAGLERPVLWARTSSHLSTLFPGLGPDELALVDLQAARELNPSLTLPRIVRALARLGVAGLALADRPDQEACLTADELGIPLFHLPPQSDLTRTARAVIRLVTDRESQEEARGADLYLALTQAIAAGTPLEALTATLSDFTGHSIFLLEAGGAVRCAAHAVAPPPAGAAEGTAAGWLVVTAPISVNEAEIGAVRLVDREGTVDRFTEITAHQSAAALALALAKEQAVSQARQALQGTLLDAILANEGSEVLRARARGLGYDLDARQWALCTTVTPPTPTAQAALAEWVRRARSLATSRGWQTLATTNDGLATLLLATASSFTDAAVWLQELRATWSPTNGALTIAAGEPAPGLEGLRATLEQAQNALSLAQRLFGPGGTHRHGELGIYRLLRHLQGVPDLDHFYTQTLAPLVAYDEEHDSELVPTLHEVLAQGGNVSRAAQNLHLHRNSLVYRLERIQQITGLDPTAPDDAFTLRLALLLAPLRGR